MPRSLEELLARADEFADSFEDYEPADGDDVKPMPALMAVKLAAFKRACAERDLADAVRSARAQSESWRAIGEAIGTSGEAARQRYGRERDAESA